MRIATKLSIAFSVTAASLIAAAVAAILLIDHLNSILADIGFYNLQTEQLAEALSGIRREPAKTERHLARLADLERWARSEQERTLIENARQALQRDRTQAQAPVHLETLAAHYRNASVAAHQRLVKIHRRAVTGIIIFMIDGTLLLVLIMFLVRRWLLNPLQSIGEAAARIAEGAPHPPLARTQPPELAGLAESLEKTAAKLKDQTGRLEHTERLATVGEACHHLTHTMSHLLASMRSLAQNERNALTGHPGARAAFQHIITSADTMQSWLRHLTATSRPLEPKLARQPLEPVVRDALSLLQPKLSERKLQVQLEPADCLPDVHIDRALLEQALLAVLTNAIEASPEGGRIRIATSGDSNGHVTLLIEDEGDGMSESVRQRAFEPFFTSKNGAAGLGLSIAHRIISAHGGRIELDSQPRNGARVRIHLPASTGNGGGPATR